MAFASVGTLGTGNSASSGTTVVITTSAAAESGNLVVVIVGKDNVQTTDGQTSEISSITDSAGGNTWTKAVEFCNGQGAADAGAVCSAWFSKITNTIASGGSITATLSSSKVSKSLTAWELTVGAGNTISVAGTPQTLANDGADPGSQTISGLASKQYLVIRGAVKETNDAGAATATAGYTLFSDAIADDGTETGSIRTSGEFRILTGTGDTSDITLPSGSGSSDAASVYFALEEVSASSYRSPSGGVAYGGRGY